MALLSAPKRAVASPSPQCQGALSNSERKGAEAVTDRLLGEESSLVTLQLWVGKPCVSCCHA